jgi:hypothetical protein
MKVGDSRVVTESFKMSGNSLAKIGDILVIEQVWDTHSVLLRNERNHVLMNARIPFLECHTSLNLSETN